LLKKHRLCDVARVLAWIFDERGGVLPFAVTFTKRRGNHRFRVRTHSKVTNLWMVLNNWDRIEESIYLSSSAGAPSGGPPDRNH
jgi:hypothetical protein